MSSVQSIIGATDSLRSIDRRPLSLDAGFNLDSAQRGLDPENWKPMKTVGNGVNEIRVRDATGAYRVIYLATRPEAIYVLHCFQKKTEKTNEQDIDLAKRRFKAIPKSSRK